MTGKQKKATISGNLGAAARDPRASSNSRDRLSRLCATVRPRPCAPPLLFQFPLVPITVFRNHPSRVKLVILFSKLFHSEEETS